jgi:hypothetical protein
MLDGRIDMQGTVKDLRARGLLESITFQESISTENQQELGKGEEREAGDKPGDGAAIQAADASVDGTPDKTKKPRRLVKDEERETGGVRWVIYKTYLKAS